MNPDERAENAIEEIAASLARHEAGAPAHLALADLRRLHETIATGAEEPRLLVILLGRHAVGAYPELSGQQFVVDKLLRRVKPSDFDFAADAEIVGGAGPALPGVLFVLNVLARDSWWSVTGWLAVWWLIMLLGDYAFAARLAELCLTGSIIAFVLFALLARSPLEPDLRDRLVASGVWQVLAGSDRGEAGLLVAAAGVSLAGVLFSHSTMMDLQARGYLTSVTSGSVRGVVVAAVTAGSVALLALATAGLWRHRKLGDRVLVEQQAVDSIVDSRRSLA